MRCLNYRSKSKNMVSLVLVLLVLLWSVGTIAVTSQAAPTGLKEVSAPTTAGGRTVRIACNINDSLYVDSEGDLGGLALPFVRQLAWNAGWNLVYVPGTYTESLRKLYDGDIDIMLPIGSEEDPEDKLYYPKYDIGIQQIGLYAKDDADIFYDDFTHFDGKSIAISEGANSDIMTEFAKKHHFDYVLNTDYPDIPSKIEALQSGKVDMIAFSTLNVVPGAKLVDVLDQVPVYVCANREKADICAELDASIRDMMIKTPDIITQCQQDMMKGNAVVSITRLEHNKIEQADTIRFGVYHDMLPLSGVDKKTGKVIGIYPDTIRAIAKKSGLNIDIVPVEDDSRLYSYMDDGTVDFVMAVFDLRFYSDNADNYLISNGIYNFSTIAVTRPDCELASGEAARFALIKSRSYMGNYINQTFPGSTITYYDTRKDCLDAVERGVEDATFINSWAFNYEKKNPRYENLVEWQNYSEVSTYAIGATKKSDMEILSIFEKTISQIPQSDISQIVAKNININYESYTLLDRLYSMRVAIITALVSLLIIGLGIHFYVREMNRRSAAYKEFMRYICTACDSVTELDLYAKKLKKYSVKNGEVDEKIKKGELHDLFIVHPDDKAKIEEIMSKDSVHRIIFHGETRSFECRAKWSEGDEYRWNTCLVQGIKPTNEKPYNLLLIVRDINGMREEQEKQKKALSDAFEQAKLASQSKGQFLSRISHEIRTPLNAIIGYMSIGESEKDHPEKMLHCIKNSDIAAKHLLSIINDVLDISSIESGKMKLAYTDFDMKTLISEITTVFFQQAKEKGIAFDVTIHSMTDEWVVGDSLRVKQVLMNLLSNAVKFTPAGGEVKLLVNQLKESGGKAFYDFEVRDTGMGMKKEFKDRMFRPFEQQDASTAQKYGGTGLGLSITKNLVDMMGGSIRVNSNEGVGTSFHVTLHFGVSKKDQTPGATVQDYSHVRVLAVDDSVDDVNYLKSLLKRCNVKGDVVTSGEAALKQLKRRMGTDYAYDLCIMDWNMPGLTGIETSKKIRELYGDELPIIIATAYDTTEIEKEAKEAGVNHVIAKPLFQSTMFDLLVSNFGKYEASDSDPSDEIDISGLHVLLAEDNEMNMEIALDIIKRAHMVADSAENGEIAVEKFVNSAPGTYDLILMDIQMPIMDGYEAARKIRASSHPDAKSVPIIAMTANAFAEDVAEALANGMNDHISKPIDKHKLFKAIKKLTDGEQE